MENVFKGIYIRLAVSNLKKNRKAYIPYIITGILTVMIFYDMYMISMNSSLEDVPGAATIQTLLRFGIVIVGIFACIFLFYTNHFLIKQRKKEIGLYNVLGMGKRNIAVMMLWESVIVGAGSIVCGILAGILFGKLFFLILYRIIRFDIAFDYEISGGGILATACLFTFIFLLTLLCNLLQIRFANPSELLRGQSAGEKEPKTKIVMTVFGIATLGAGYYIANTITDPVAAVTAFFAAVMLVIAGTYALFVAGSVAFLKLLRKNRKFYYQAKHFHAVSGMICRMKQNAVGLANICILSTMVLVTVSSTVSLNMGLNNIMKNRFPREHMMEVYEGSSENILKIDRIVMEELEKMGLARENTVRYQTAAWVAERRGDTFETKRMGYGTYYAGKSSLQIIPVRYYNEMCGEDIALSDKEVLIYTPNAEEYGEELVKIGEDTFEVAGEPETVPTYEKERYSLMNTYLLFVKDEAVMERLRQKYGGGKKMPPEYIYGFDLDGTKEESIQAAKNIQKRISAETDFMVVSEEKYSYEEDFYAFYGCFLFLGIFLGGLFLMAAVLIIYYKQISEGYEDRSRYQIMRKVGMSQKEIQKSIKSQVRMVFLLPLGAAVIHAAGAFHMVELILRVMNLTNTKLFAACTVGTVLVFAVIYSIVFKITAKEYYKIVTR